MGGRINHAAANVRSRAARNGIENIHDMGVPGGLYAPRHRPSKADQRAEIEAAIQNITRTVTCDGCGHTARVALPPAKAGRRLRCSRCGSSAGVVQ